MKTGMCSLVIALAFVIPSHAQTATPIIVNASGCGFVRGTGPLNCYATNMTIGGKSGTAWVYPNWILFRPGLEGAATVMANVTSTKVTYDNVGLVTQETITFEIASPSLNGNSADPDNNGDADVVTGSVTFDFSYGPAGRYGMRVLTVSGSGAQSITHD